MRRFALPLLVLISVAVFAPVATAQFGGGGGLQTEPKEEPQAPNRQDDDGFGSTETLIVLLAGGLLLGGVAWWIMRDARSLEPSDGHEEDRARSKAEREADHVRRKQDSRKKGKAAKKARRHNRPR